MAARADDDQAGAQLGDEVVHHLALAADADMDLGRDAGLLGDLDRRGQTLLALFAMMGVDLILGHEGRDGAAQVGLHVEQVQLGGEAGIEQIAGMAHGAVGGVRAVDRDENGLHLRHGGYSLRPSAARSTGSACFFALARRCSQ